MSMESVMQSALGGGSGSADANPTEVRITNHDSPRLQAVAAEIKPLRDRAKSASRLSSQVVDSINADENLSADGKRNALAEQRDQDKASMKALRDQEIGVINSAIAEAERKLDGQIGYSDSNIIAFRDAQDRAENIHSADEANRIMERAIRTRDHTLAHAVYRRAIDAGYRDVLAPFAAAYPEAASAMNDLGALRRLRDEGGMQRAIAYSSASTLWNR